MYSMLPQQGLINHLAAILQPEMIYCYRNCLHIVVRERPDKTMGTYKSLVYAATAGRDWQLPPFYLHEYTAVRAGIEEGHLMYSNMCTDAGLLYRNPKEWLPAALHQRLGQAIRLCRGHFDTGLQRSLSFAGGARMYHGKGEQDMAAFMLHQSIELLLRYLLLAVTGKEVRTHSLKENLQHCRSFAPELYGYCLEDRALNVPKGIGEGGSEASPGLGQTQSTEELKPLIGHLDKAYSCARYATVFTIGAGRIAEALQLVKDLQQQAQQLMDQLLQTLTALPVAAMALSPLQPGANGERYPLAALTNGHE